MVRQRSSPLRNLRRSRTLSQQDLARLLRISQQTLSKYERGQLLPPVDMRARIAAILGVAVAEAFGAPDAAPADLGQVSQ